MHRFVHRRGSDYLFYNIDIAHFPAIHRVSESPHRGRVAGGLRARHPRQPRQRERRMTFSRNASRVVKSTPRSSRRASASSAGDPDQPASVARNRAAKPAALRAGDWRARRYRSARSPCSRRNGEVAPPITAEWYERAGSALWSGRSRARPPTPRRMKYAENLVKGV